MGIWDKRSKYRAFFKKVIRIDRRFDEGYVRPLGRGVLLGDEHVDQIIVGDAATGALDKTMKRLPPEYPCHGCLNAVKFLEKDGKLNVKLCDGRHVYATDDGTLICDERLTKDA